MIHHHSPISGIAAFQQKYIATAGYDNRVILWDWSTHEALAVGFHDHLANSCAFSKDGSLLVTASSDHTARLWEVPSMKLVAVCRDHTDDVECARIHPREPWIATASLDHKVRVFDLSGRLLKIFHGHTADAITVEWNDVRQSLMSCGDEGAIREWKMDHDECVSMVAVGDAETDSLTLTRNGTIFAGNDEGSIFIIPAGSNIPKKIPAHSAGVKRIAINSTHSRLATVSYDRKLIIWSILPNEEVVKLGEWPLDEKIWPRSCAFVGDNHIIFGTFGTTYATFDLQTQTWDVSRVKPTHGTMLVKFPGLSIQSEIQEF